MSLNSNLFVGADVSLNHNLYVNNDSILNNKLFVASDVSLNHNLYVNNDLIVNNDTCINTYKKDSDNTLNKTEDINNFFIKETL